MPGCRFAIWDSDDALLYTFPGNFPVGEQLKAHLFIARNIAGQTGLLDEDGNPMGTAVPFSVSECSARVYHRITQPSGGGWLPSYGMYIDTPSSVIVYSVWAGATGASSDTIDNLAPRVAGAATGMQRWKVDVAAIGVTERLPRIVRISMLPL